MTDKQIIINGLSCDNCPEAQRCQEQQTKKEYAINQVLQDIPSEYANVINRLKQIIPSITRCDYVLEKQLKRKEQECEKLKKELFSFMNGDYCKNGCSLKQQLDQLKAEKEEFKKILIEIQQDLEFATYCECQECGCDDPNECLECTKKQILQKISEVEND